jgi:hypothetical protein
MGVLSLSYWRAKREFQSFEKLLKYIRDTNQVSHDRIRDEIYWQALLKRPKDKSTRSLK